MKMSDSTRKYLLAKLDQIESELDDETPITTKLHRVARTWGARIEAWIDARLPEEKKP
jgi:hypothetical protein